MLKRIWNWIKGLFAPAERVVLAFLGAAADALLKNGGALLVEIAEDAVAAAEAEGGSGAANLEAALEIIRRDMGDKGIKASENAIRLAIEAAVAQLKTEVK